MASHCYEDAKGTAVCLIISSFGILSEHRQLSISSQQYHRSLGRSRARCAGSGNADAATQGIEIMFEKGPDYGSNGHEKEERGLEGVGWTLLNDLDEEGT